MKKFAEDLAKDYDFETKDQYYNYIVESLINGQRQQVRNLFNKMKGYDQKKFLIDYLENDNSFHTSTRNICIGELIQ